MFLMQSSFITSLFANQLRNILIVKGILWGLPTMLSLLSCSG